MKTKIILLLALALAGLSGWGQTEFILNGSFSNNLTNWTYSSKWDWFTSSPSPNGGIYAMTADPNGYAWTYLTNENIYQTVTIPSNATAATLSYYYKLNTDNTGSGVSLQVRFGSSTLATYYYTNATWIYASIPISNISSYLGQSVDVKFVGNESSSNSYWGKVEVDGVSLMVTVPPCTGVTAVTTQPQSQTICSGNSVTLSVATNGTGPFLYFWKDGSGTVVGNNSTYPTSTPGLYYCIVTNCSSMYQVISNTATLTVTANPTTPTITGNTTFCSGQSTTLSVTSPCTGCTYTWSPSGSGTSINVTSAGTYTATAHNSCGDAGPSNSLNVTVNPSPTTPTITGNTTFCSGQSTTLSVTSPCTGCTYTWSPSGSGTSINVTSAGTYTATAHNSCGDSGPSNSLNVTVSPGPTTPVIVAQGGITSFCQGTGSAILQVSNPCTGCNYTWYPSGSGTSINVTSGGTYYCTSSNTCGGPSPQSNSITITVNTVPTVSFTQSGAGLVYNFTDNSTGSPISWNWNFGDPASGVNNTSTSQNPQHTFSGAGTYNVSLQASNICGSNSYNQNVMVSVGIDEWHSININNISITPNPISNSAVINFSVIKGGKISIELFDILEKKIFIISESEYIPGDYSLIIERPHNLKSGKYFIRFVSEGYSAIINVIYK